MIRLSGTSKQGNILLNEKTDLLFDAKVDKQIKIVKLTFDSNPVVTEGKINRTFWNFVMVNLISIFISNTKSKVSCLEQIL